MKTLKTDRLILRDWKKNDLDDLFEYASVEGVGEMAGWSHHTDKEVSKGILQSFIDGGDVYAIVLKENKKVIGSLGLHDKSADANFKAKTQREMGYVIGKDYWGQGLATEAAQVAIKYAFEKLRVDVLWCCHFAENMQSKRVIQKCGFAFHGKGIFEAKLINKTFDDMKYIMTKNDYKALTEK
ncbi:MAG: GNAT family N-acetyltransferase [Defluviitaleaceae bacterium]|nr:GNAT family N-acetyltransferase [Defluviitaleaceae bacterium]